MKAPFSTDGSIMLGQISGMYPDGMSLANYQRLTRLIRKHGSAAKVSMRFSHDSDDEHDRLTAFLADIENGKISASAW